MKKADIIPTSYDKPSTELSNAMKRIKFVIPTSYDKPSTEGGKTPPKDAPSYICTSAKVRIVMLELNMIS